MDTVTLLKDWDFNRKPKTAYYYNDKKELKSINTDDLNGVLMVNKRSGEIIHNHGVSSPMGSFITFYESPEQLTNLFLGAGI